MEISALRERPWGNIATDAMGRPRDQHHLARMAVAPSNHLRNTMTASLKRSFIFRKFGPPALSYLFSNCSNVISFVEIIESNSHRNEFI